MKATTGKGNRVLVARVLKAFSRGRDVIGRINATDVEANGDIIDGVVGFGMLGQSHQNAFRAENPCLFAGNLGDRAVEPFHVIESDVRNDGDKRPDDVGGIKASAKANFENGYFDLLLGKVEEGESCHDLKE
jgi:hypothetical protein